MFFSDLAVLVVRTCNAFYKNQFNFKSLGYVNDMYLLDIVNLQ